MDFSYWIKLNRALKKLLREVIRCHDEKMQEKHLAKVYAWFMRKLESVGMQTGMEKTEAEIFLNPAKIDQIHE